MPTASAVRLELPLLAGMTRDIEETGSLRRPTAIAMWWAYAAHAIATGWALSHTDQRIPVPAPLAVPIGRTSTLAGLLLVVGGMRRFNGIRRIEGTQPQQLITNGLYRWSRNPQYLGYLTALCGAALVRRSLAATALAGAIGLTYAAWIPVEERQLALRHGQTYTDYLQRTHRWWGLPRERS